MECCACVDCGTNGMSRDEVLISTDREVSRIGLVTGERLRG